MPSSADKPAAPKSPKPFWLEKYGIALHSGDWMYQAKAQWKALMRPCFPLKVRVYACLMLHTTAFQSELAVRVKRKSDNDDDPKVRLPIKPIDIIRELHEASKAYYRGAGIDGKEIRIARDGKTIRGFDAFRETSQNIRRELAALEADGVAERRTPEGKPLRELSDDERRKLSGDDKVRYFAWIEPRKATQESVRREYEDRVSKLSDFRGDEGSQIRLPFDAKTISNICLISKVFEISNSPSVRLSLETTELHVHNLAHSIDSAKVAFIQSLKDREPNSDLEIPAIEGQQPFASVSPSSTNEIPAKEVPPNDNIPVAQPEPGIQTRYGQHIPGSPPSNDLHHGLILRGFTTLEREDLEKIAYALENTPLDRFWILLDERRRRGDFGFVVLLNKAQAAKMNYRESAELLRQQQEHNREANEARQQEMIVTAKAVLANSQDHSPEEIDWAKEVLAS